MDSLYENITIEEFVIKLVPLIKKQSKENKLKPEVVKLAVDLLILKFNSKELKGSLEYEVNTAIFESIAHYGNCK